MSVNSSAISWTGHTWSPVVGCSPDSAGCDLCWSIMQANMRMSNPSPTVAAAYAGTVDRATLTWTGLVRCLPERLAEPLTLSTKRRLLIFVCSVSDLFHPQVPDHFIAQVFAVMARCPQHTFQILTKRSARMRTLLNQRGQKMIVAALAAGLPDVAAVLSATQWPMPHVWAGVSAEDQTAAERRIWHLSNTDAACRWVSAEPQIGPIDYTRLHVGAWLRLNALTGRLSDPYGDPHGDQPQRGRVDWVVVGGESGPLHATDRRPAARPLDLEWVGNTFTQCRRAHVAFHFKQLGVQLAAQLARPGSGAKLDDLPAGLRVREMPTLTPPPALSATG